MTVDRTRRRVCLVTGGAGPQLGQGISLALAQHDNHVVVADASILAARETAARLREAGYSASASFLDVTDRDSVRNMVDQTIAEFGGVDALVNSAGVGLDRALTAVSESDFETLMQVNVRGALWCAQAVAEPMTARGGGSIVHIGSVHAGGAAPGYGLYAASKAALAAMSRGLAVELGGAQIRSNVVHPGALRRESDLDPVSGDPEVRERHAAFALARQAIHVPIRPVDVGNVVAFLVSDDARVVSGIELAVDAGTAALLHDLNPSASRPN